MATKQRGVYRRLVLCLSVLLLVLSVSARSDASDSKDVMVTNPASSPVQTQNVGGGAATQVGQPASKIVNLSCQELVNSGTCGSTLSGPAFTVPRGQALIVTDVQWGFFSSNGQGNYDGIDINVGVGSFTRVSSSSALVDSKGSCQGELHLATGIVVPPGGSVQIENGLNGSNVSVGAFLQGYLVPNQ